MPDEPHSTPSHYVIPSARRIGRHAGSCQAQGGRAAHLHVLAPAGGRPASVSLYSEVPARGARVVRFAFGMTVAQAEEFALAIREAIRLARMAEEEAEHAGGSPTRTP